MYTETGNEKKEAMMSITGIRMLWITFDYTSSISGFYGLFSTN